MAGKDEISFSKSLREDFNILGFMLGAMHK